MVSRGFWDDSDDRSKVIYCLQRDEVVLGTSDTVLGLLAPVSEKAFNRLNSIKGRYEKPYIILIAGIEQLKHFTPEIEHKGVFKLLERCWPGPLTVILPALPSLPAYACSVDRTVALRVPQHDGLLSVLPRFKGLYSTSANRAGQPVAQTLAEVDPQIEELACSIVSGRNENKKIIPSTILDCSKGQPRLVREGALSADLIEEIIGFSLVR